MLSAFSPELTGLMAAGIGGNLLKAQPLNKLTARGRKQSLNLQRGLKNDSEDPRSMQLRQLRILIKIKGDDRVPSPSGSANKCAWHTVSVTP